MPLAQVIDSPIGPLRLESADGVALSAIRFDGRTDPNDESAPVLHEAARQLLEYFAGRRRDFDVPLAPTGTSFQREVWSQVAAVPFGTTATYGQIAEQVGHPVSSARAIGAASGANPIPIMVPCHRIIGADGTLTGYGGGVARKQVLLHLEGVPTEGDQLELFPAG
ncbi:MAG: methylated-DNA--[protein]-cysteine S-methyltransferase [Candidatus Phosphoribacter sp.]